MDRLNIVKCWMDVSYAMHLDFQSHTGMMMSLGWVLVVSMTKRQKKNSRISTEAELIREDKVLTEFLWSRYFIEV